jgi:hypothetical protein
MSALIAGLKTAQFWLKAAPWIAGLLALAGVVLFIDHRGYQRGFHKRDAGGRRSAERPSPTCEPSKPRRRPIMSLMYNRWKPLKPQSQRNRPMRYPSSLPMLALLCALTSCASKPIKVMPAEIHYPSLPTPPAQLMTPVPKPSFLSPISTPVPKLT